MDYGDLVLVNSPNHPFFNYIGKVIGKRGKRSPDDMLLLILINNRSYIIPESMLILYKTNEKAD